MKKLLIIILPIFSCIITASAQKINVCADITLTSQSDDKLIYSSPTVGDQASLFRIAEVGRTYTYFRLSLYMPEVTLTQSDDAEIIFNDGEILKFPNPSIAKGNKNNRTQGYFYTNLPLSATDIAKLQTKPIKYYKLFYTKVVALAQPSKIMNYSICVNRLFKAFSGIDPILLMNKTYDEMQGKTTYTSPTGENIVLTKAATASQSVTALRFYVYKNAQGNGPQTVYVKFNDGTISTLPSTGKCIISADGDYVYIATVTLNDTTIKNFKEKTILKFQTADVDVPVDDVLATSLNKWVNNLENLK